MSLIYTAYYDRPKDGINGVFTLQDNKGHKLIDRVQARSGQKGYTGGSWVRGKSPIPYGTHRMSLSPYSRGVAAGKTGIGQFYPIGNDGGFYRIKEGLKQRTAIGLHEENQWEGSAGCVVIVKHSDWLRVMSVLDQIAAEGITDIDFKVV